MNPLKAAEKLFFAVFGQARNSDLMAVSPTGRSYRPDWTKSLFKIVFGAYMLVTVVVLVKLLIATMSDTYQQIQAQSYIEWKFGLSKLIRNIDRATTAPSPINLITTWLFYLADVCKARVVMTPLKAAEKLFFAILGPLRNSNHLVAVPPEGHPPYQPTYAKRLFKIGFGAYMLVMVVLFKLLIATMSDTYQQIQAQSYTEWKFGLCKLIRKIDRQTTAPSPLNLINTWFFILTEVCKPRVQINPIEVFELLFFAVFGQTLADDLQTKRHRQSKWTENLFKMVFGVYMLVSVVVLINLLIAMMTDTYQRIQAQSDIEWKFGLSKLIRNMHRTTTAPAPINLITTWLFYLVDLCRERAKKKRKRPNLVTMVSTLQGKQQMSPRSKAGAKWLARIKKASQVVPEPSPPPPLMHLGSPIGSQMEFSQYGSRIEHVVDWEDVARRYRALMGYTVESTDVGNPEPDINENIKRTNTLLQASGNPV